MICKEYSGMTAIVVVPVEEPNMKSLSLKRAVPLRRREMTLPPGSEIMIAGGLSVMIWGIVAAVALL
jgi:hypothetical protein